MTYGLLTYAIIPKELYCPDLLWIVFTFQDSPDQRGWSAGSRFREPIKSISSFYNRIKKILSILILW